MSDDVPLIHASTSYTTFIMLFFVMYRVQGGSNMTGTDLCVNKPHCAAAVRS